MGTGTLQHFRAVCGPLLASKEDVVNGLSGLSTCTLISLFDIDPIEVSVQPIDLDICRPFRAERLNTAEQIL